MSMISRLRIEKLHAEYLVGERHPSPERLARRLDEVVRKELPAALRAMLTPALRADDPSVWIIHRIEVPVYINAAWEPDEIGRSWSRQITKALVPDLCGTGDSTNVVRFQDRAAYLAQFVADAASGEAWSHWFYRSFDGLRMLPISAAIRTALLEDAACGLVALQRLPLPELARVVGALAETDATILLNAWASEDGGAALDSALAAVSAQWQSVAAFSDVSSGFRTALVLSVRAAAAGATGRAAVVAAKAVAGLAAVAHGLPGDVVRRLLRALVSDDMTSVREIAGVAAPVLDALARLPGPLLEAAFATVAPLPAAPISTEGPRRTPFGGALLLLPLLGALPLDAVADWPSLGETSAAQALRWLVLVKCASQPRADSAFQDPLLRDLFCLMPDIGWPEFAAWLEALGDPRREALAEALSHEPASELGTRVTVRVSCRGEELSLRIGAQGFWRALTPCDGEAAPPTDDLTIEPQHSEVELDLDYLALPSMTGVTSAWDRVFTVGAQQVLRSFLQRLPGFGESGCAYLHRNFLAFSASVEFEATRLVVRIGRPPLHLILSLTGATRGTFQLSWLDPRPLSLFSED
jgi:hypothetical protein